MSEISIRRLKNLPRKRLLTLEEIARAWGVSVVQARRILHDVLGVKSVGQ